MEKNTVCSNLNNQQEMQNQLLGTYFSRGQGNLGPDWID